MTWRPWRPIRLGFWGYFNLLMVDYLWTQLVEWIIARLV